MNPNWIILLIGLGAGSLPTWWITSSYYQGMISAEHEAQQKLVIEQQKQNRLALLAYAKRITEGNDQHDKDQIAINRLAADARRVSVHFPACPVPGAAEPEGNIGGASGVLSNPVDAYFAEFQDGVGALIEKCEQLNIDAIRANKVAD